MVKNVIQDNVVAQNKKAHYDYEIIETFEAGIVLTGTEIKSVRRARINIRDGFARVRNGEVWLSNVHISPLMKVIFGMLTKREADNFYYIRSKSAK